MRGRGRKQKGILRKRWWGEEEGDKKKREIENKG